MRHANVEQERVEARLLAQVLDFTRIVGGGDIKKTLSAEDFVQQPDIGGFVIDNQDIGLQYSWFDTHWIVATVLMPIKKPKKTVYTIRLAIAPDFDDY